MNQSELARRTNRPIKTINEIIRGKAAITPETAIQLERVLGVSARFWNGLESTFRDHLAREQARQELEGSTAWLDGFPLTDLFRRKLIPRHANKADIVGALLSFFRVSSPSAWERHWLNPLASYRASETFMASPKATAAWLRWGEIEAAKVGVPAFDSQRFREVLKAIPPLTRRAPFSQIFKQVQAMCAEAGVIVLLTPELEGTRVSGVARWMGDRPVIQLSARHKTDDQFWFAFFHEAGHILQSTRRRAFIEILEEDDAQDRTADEADANTFARDTLVPREYYDAFVAAGEITEDTVRRFAKEQDVAPGIVVGRLQRDGLVDPSHMYPLKKKISLPS